MPDITETIGSDFQVIYIKDRSAIPEPCPCGAKDATEFTPLDIRDNPDYPEVPTGIRQDPGITTIFGSVPGTTLPATENDPRCFDPLYPRGSNCKRICGSLPPGRKFVRVIRGTITPGGWARFGELEVYANQDPVRFCLRCKNWAEHTMKVFLVEVEHAPK
jgi:hypothetical protein